jgi:hypothetical protein
MAGVGASVGACVAALLSTGAVVGFWVATGVGVAQPVNTVDSTSINSAVRLTTRMVFFMFKLLLFRISTGFAGVNP